MRWDCVNHLQDGSHAEEAASEAATKEVELLAVVVDKQVCMSHHISYSCTRQPVHASYVALQQISQHQFCVLVPRLRL